MSEDADTRRYRAAFNETEKDLEDCRELVEHAVQHSFGLHLVEVERTISASNGDLENNDVVFEIGVNDVPEEDRTPKGRMLEHLGGSDVRLHALD